MGLSRAAEWAHKVTVVKAAQPKFECVLSNEDGEMGMSTVAWVHEDGTLTFQPYEYVAPADARRLAAWILETFKTGDDAAA